MEKVGNVSHYTTFVRLSSVAEIGYFQQLRDSQVLRGDLESKLSITVTIRLLV